MLELPDVSRLINDPILHSLYWPPILTKISSDFPKFEGKSKEDPHSHVTTYHLWCSSNSYIDDFVHLCLFQWTLKNVVTKWYIELRRGTYADFNSLAMAFLTHFQLPILYETGTHFLTFMKQDTTKGQCPLVYHGKQSLER